MSNGTPRAYSNAIVGNGSASRAVVRFTCVSCTHELEIANNNMRNHGTFYAAQAKKRGWDTDGMHANRVFCPDCRKTPAPRSRRQHELDSVVIPALQVVASEPPVIDGVAEEVSPEGFTAGALTAVEKAAEDVVRGIAMLPTLRKEKPAMARELSNEQRRAIRVLLDQYFDDKEGCYLALESGEPMNDQAVGSMAGVPWGEVTKIREASYGKILVDPALAALRAQMDELYRTVQEQLAILDRRMNEMRSALDGYGARKQARAS